MKTPHAALGFLAVAALIGLLEWRSSQSTGSNELLITEAQRAFVREQVLQTSVQGANNTGYEQAMAQYIDEEILYREGLKLGLENDDLIVKRRVVQKMRFLLEDMTPVAAPTPDQLQTWLEQNPKRYQTEQGIRFQHHFFSRGKRGDEAIYNAETALNDLRGGQEIVADPFPLRTSETMLSRDQVTKEMGNKPASVLFELPLEQWSDPVQSGLGVHLFKVMEKTQGRVMTVEEAGTQLLSDLMAAQRKAVNDAGMAALRATYTIKESP